MRYNFKMPSTSAAIESSRPSRLAYIAPYAAIVLALFVAAYPMMVLYPFRAQGKRELLAALTLLHWAPWITALCVLVACGGLLLQKWTLPAGRRAWIFRGLRILASAICVLGCVGALLFARVNKFEKIFHPAGAPSFLPSDQAKVAPDDMVMTVSAGAIAHAYPILEMAYHHVVNDYVGDTPVAATY